MDLVKMAAGYFSVLSQKQKVEIAISLPTIAEKNKEAAFCWADALARDTDHEVRLVVAAQLPELLDADQKKGEALWRMMLNDHDRNLLSMLVRNAVSLIGEESVSDFGFTIFVNAVKSLDVKLRRAAVTALNDLEKRSSEVAMECAVYMAQKENDIVVRSGLGRFAATQWEASHKEAQALAHILGYQADDANSLLNEVYQASNPNVAVELYKAAYATLGPAAQ